MTFLFSGKVFQKEGLSTWDTIASSRYAGTLTTLVDYLGIAYLGGGRSCVANFLSPLQMLISANKKSKIIVITYLWKEVYPLYKSKITILINGLFLWPVLWPSAGLEVVYTFLSSLLVKGVFSPVPTYHGYFVPSQFTLPCCWSLIYANDHMRIVTE